MADPIDMYFDFASPYGYLALFRIDAIAEKHERSVNWRPYLLGAVFQRNGQRSLVEQPLKGEYSLHDLERSARLYGVEFKMPEPFPIPTVAAGRVFYFLHDQDEQLARDFAEATMTAFFADGIDIRPRETVAEIAGGLGADVQACIDATNDQSYKDRLREETRTAMDRGAFGSPYFIVDGEPFWGCDRMEMMDQWLERGGW